jgi:hypothetical protein
MPALAPVTSAALDAEELLNAERCDRHDEWWTAVAALATIVAASYTTPRPLDMEVVKAAKRGLRGLLWSSSPETIEFMLDWE